MSDPIRARLFNGTRDLLPEEMIPRRRMLDAMTRVFESFGFAPVETPVVEFLEILLGKYGAEAEKLLYPLAYKGGDVLGLRYDLTVPLSRLVAMNRQQLPMPFKRYQIQPVYRADRPQPRQGRYREFYQCDVDTVGTASIAADAENVAVCHAVYDELGLTDEELGLAMRLNNRKVLRALVEASGLPADRDAVVCTALDKIDKIGREKVEVSLDEEGIAADARGKLFDLIELSREIGPTNHDGLLEELYRRLDATSTGREGLDEMAALFEGLDALGVPRDQLHFDLVLTRGLDYYTGPIYEFVLTSLDNFGSLGGGGRYDDLMSLYGGEDIPATGVSIGLSRVQSALERLELLEKRSSPTQVLVLGLPDSTSSNQLAVARRLREAGIPAEIYYDAGRFKKQIVYAERKGVPYVVIQGPKEVERDVVQLKDIRVGEQVEVALDDLAATVQRGLASSAGGNADSSELSEST